MSYLKNYYCRKFYGQETHILSQRSSHPLMPTPFSPEFIHSIQVNLRKIFQTLIQHLSTLTFSPLSLVYFSLEILPRLLRWSTRGI